MIVHCKLQGIATKKNEVFGVFRRGGFSSKIKYFDHFLAYPLSLVLHLEQEVF